MARICVIRQWNFPNDPRLGREVGALARAGYDVDVICVKWPDQPLFERSGRLAVFRVPISRRRGGRVRYVVEFATFMVAATLLVALLAPFRRYAVVQVNSIPDSLVFVSLVPRLLGARVLLDLHECMPEFFALKYKLPAQHTLVRALGLCEQVSIRFADAAITCTEQMRERFAERGARKEKIGVILNSFDDQRFDPRRYSAVKRDRGHFVL